jgi:hypothetical protein
MSSPQQPAREAPTPQHPTEIKRSRRLRRWTIRGLKAAGILIALWLAAAYAVLPAVWRHYEHNPKLADAPKTTMTAQGNPGDPLNVGLAGEEKSLVQAMLAAGWQPADPITFHSSVRIAESVLFKRPDPHAPVSNLYLFGRRQDLAFEKQVGGNARRRHHVRFWRWVEAGHDGLPLWIGSATFDVSVGFSHLTGQVTHHIAPDIDSERRGLIIDLVRAGWLTRIYQVTGVGATIAGRNGGGDHYDTDGELTIGILARVGEAGSVPDFLANPPAVRFKEQLWTAVRPLLRTLAPNQ